jgi:hypothetical protein
MPAVAEHQVPATRRLARDPRRIRVVAQVTVTALVALLVALGAIFGGSDSPADRFNVSEIGVTGPFGGVRYDGGPEEGSRGSFSISSAPTGRPDGGPEEGTRGPGR